ncbi:hypothetical protein, partial [Brachyspira catarrhinii]|uniref:hypothetical protein n=1 Tax=Brachyspira catarrhinii TaxID=2528966 RepID=UPI00191E7F7E
RNQTNNVFKVKRQKSKLFITILCIFGLLFSYSCQCKNNVSDPTGGDNGGKGDDSGEIIRTNGGAVSGSYQIVVASAGDTVSTTATVKFLNATGTLTAIADVDASASTGLAVGDFDYTGTTLTFKKDTTDASKYDATTLAKVSWAGTETKKVKATFSLTPTSTNVDLTTTTQDVEIEIKKIQKLDDSTSDAIQSILRKGTRIGNTISQVGGDKKFEFLFKNGTYNATDKTFTIENATTDNLDISKPRVKDYADYNFTNALNPHGLAGVRVEGEEAGGGTSDTYYTLTYNVTFSQDFETEITQIKLKLDNKSTSIKFVEERN